MVHGAQSVMTVLMKTMHTLSVACSDTSNLIILHYIFADSLVDFLKQL